MVAVAMHFTSLGSVFGLRESLWAFFRIASWGMWIVLFAPTANQRSGRAESYSERRAYILERLPDLSALSL
jgi:hypothetical protein